MSEPEQSTVAKATTKPEEKPAVTTLKDLTFYAPPEVPDKARYISQVKEYLLGSKKAASYSGNWPEPSNTELLLFLQVCKSSGLNPLTKQIYAIYRAPRKGEEPKLTIQTSIDGLRSIAEKTTFYAGSDDGTFEYRDDFEQKKYPYKASVTVYKINRITGDRMPTTASARWAEYFPGEYQGKMWLKMPETMLEKCAEAKALRKAFPNTAGLYIEEEMQQADRIVVPQAAKDDKKIAADVAAARKSLTTGSSKPSTEAKDEPNHANN
jgi:phage recombination protein Bet